jgi:hypothetical protein
MNQREASLQAKKILRNRSATAFEDQESPLFPYLIAIKTPSGEMGVIATGLSYSDALRKARDWKKLQGQRTQIWGA